MCSRASVHQRIAQRLCRTNLRAFDEYASVLLFGKSGSSAVYTPETSNQKREEQA
jgi:hypothetical protein